MEKRTILAFVLSMAVLWVFQYIQGANAPKKGPIPPGATATGTAGGVTGTAAPSDATLIAGPGAGAADGPGTGGAGTGATAGGATETAGTAAGTGTGAVAGAGAGTVAAEVYPVELRAIENQQVIATFSSRGAALLSWRLKGFHDEHGRPLDLMQPAGVSAGALVLTTSGGRHDARLAEVAWAIVEAGPSQVIFRSPAQPDGTVVTKAIRFSETSYGLDVDVRFENRGAADAPVNYTLYAASHGITPDDEGREFVPEGHPYNGPISAVAGVLDGEHVTLRTEPALKVPEHAAEGKLEFADNTTFGGVASKYFAAVLMPPAGKAVPSPTLFFERVTVPLEADRQPYAGARAAYRVARPASALTVPAGGRVEHRWRFFAGPKIDDVLAQYAPQQLGRVLDYTSWIPGAESLSSLFLWVLRRLHGLTGSWGIAIIMLTFFVRTAVHPLSRASIKNMDKMQRLSPKIREIQKKYEGKKSKEAQQKQTLEVMELYKKHNASPVLGCLPTFVQFPVFIGLYNALAYSIELRRTDFLYMHDLSKPDRLFSFGGANVWFFGGYFNLLPLLMVATMIIQQRMQPPPPDPTQAQQQKMMQYMMVFFGALFYHVPAGLVVYFLTSSLLGMLETKWVKAQIARDHAAA